MAPRDFRKSRSGKGGPRPTEARSKPDQRGPRVVPGAASGQARVTLVRGKSKPFWVGHPWVFSGAIQEVQGGPGPAVLLDERGNEVAWGHWNPDGQIAMRLLWHRRTTDVPFAPPSFAELVRERLRVAILLRRTLGLPREGTDVFRLVNAEGDGLTGLIVDRLGPVLSVQLNSRAMYDARALISQELRAATGVSRVLLAVTDTASKLEAIPAGIEGEDGEGDEARITVHESNLAYPIDLGTLQKTGFYADQRENRARFGALSAGATVLDAYCHLGGFGLAAARAGASRVTQVDSSEPAILGARQAARMNGLSERIDALAEDAVVYLKEAQAVGKSWDRIVVDPPKLAQGRGHIDDALQKYARINTLALASVAPGGLLLTCSCSRHVSPDEFGRMLTDAGHRLRRGVRVLDQWGQPADHPSLSVAPEGRYLKAWLVAID